MHTHLKRRKSWKTEPQIFIQTALRFLVDPELCMQGEEPRNQYTVTARRKKKKAHHNLTIIHHRINKVWNLSPAKLEGLGKHVGYFIKVPGRLCRIKTMSQDKCSFLKQGIKFICCILSK